MSTRRKAILATSLVLLTSASFAAQALAGFPGRNGKIAYTLGATDDGDSNYSDIYTMSALLSGPSMLLSSSGDLDDPAWSPNGQHIAYSQRDTDGTYGNIYIANADGSGAARLTSGPKSEDRPGWSADGAKILYTTTTGDSYDALRYFLYVVNTDGSANTALISDSPDVLLGPVWSPSGRKIAYSRYSGSDGDVWTMNADGSAPRPLAHSRLVEDAPDWSPDGRKIVFSRRDSDGTGFNIYTMNADGSHQTLVNDRRFTQTDPVWSPNGKLIAYANYDGEEGRTGNYEVCTMTARGRRVRCTDSAKWEHSPDWQALR